MLTSPPSAQTPPLGLGARREVTIPRTRSRSARRKVSLATVHDRQATELPANAQVRVVTVDDPYEPGAKITAVASLRGDPLGRLHERRQIDEAQYQAGRHYQRLLEQAELGSIKAMDTTKEPVDGGGGFPEPITDRQRKAVKELARADHALGIHGREIVRDVLGLRCSMAQVAARRGLNGDRAAEYLGARFRECLDTLVVAFNYAGTMR